VVHVVDWHTMWTVTARGDWACRQRTVPTCSAHRGSRDGGVSHWLCM